MEHLEKGCSVNRWHLSHVGAGHPGLQAEPTQSEEKPPDCECRWGDLIIVDTEIPLGAVAEGQGKPPGRCLGSLGAHANRNLQFMTYSRAVV